MTTIILYLLTMDFCFWTNFNYIYYRLAGVYLHRFSSLSLETLLRIITTGGETMVLRLSLIKLATMKITQVVIMSIMGKFVELWHYVEQTVSYFIKYFSK